MSYKERGLNNYKEGRACENRIYELLKDVIKVNQNKSSRYFDLSIPIGNRSYRVEIKSKKKGNYPTKKEWQKGLKNNTDFFIVDNQGDIRVIMNINNFKSLIYSELTLSNLE